MHVVSLKGAKTLVRLGSRLVARALDDGVMLVSFAYRT